VKGVDATRGGGGTGGAQIVADRPDPGGMEAVLPGIMIAARRAAAPCTAMHAAAGFTVDGRGSAGSA
jgi:hypothetical protein